MKKSTRKTAGGIPAPEKDRKARAERFFAALAQEFPDADCSLSHVSPFQLLIATILSAQCTDVQVNKITPALFEAFPDPESLAKAPIGRIENLIRSTGFFHNKAKNIRAACQAIVKHHGGEVPGTMEELTALPGVGRKTANVVLGNGFGLNEGFVVDTHVFRLSHRMGLAEGTTPEKVERELMQIAPREDWSYLSHTLVLHGRGHCKARKPDCEGCPMTSFCPKIGVKEKG